MQPLIPLLNMFSSPCREITYHPFDAVVAEACHPPNGNSTERKAQGNEQRGGITNISYKELSFEQNVDKIAVKRVSRYCSNNAAPLLICPLQGAVTLCNRYPIRYIKRPYTSSVRALFLSRAWCSGGSWLGLIERQALICGR